MKPISKGPFLLLLVMFVACQDMADGKREMQETNKEEKAMNNTGHEYDTTYLGKEFANDYMAYNIDLHMRQLADWVDWGTTADRFKAGDPSTKIKKMAVAWMGTMDAMVQAHGSGCNVLVVHEPIYFNHFDHYGPVEHDPGFQAKKAFLDRTGMVVYRCHDVWDYVPVIGVRDSWAALLGMAPGDSSSWEGKQNARVYQLAEPLKIGELSQGIVEKVKPYGQGYVRIAGDPEKEISRLGLGTGMVHGIQVLRSFQEHGADAVVATELMEWRDVHWALENGLSIIHLSHGVSESKGIENLAAYLQKLFPKIEVIYIPSGNNPYSVFMP